MYKEKFSQREDESFIFSLPDKNYELALLLQNKPHLVEPLDFEDFILKNKTVLQNDPQRELLLYPSDDISVSSI